MTTTEQAIINGLMKPVKRTKVWNEQAGKAKVAYATKTEAACALFQDRMRGFDTVRIYERDGHFELTTQPGECRLSATVVCLAERAKSDV